MSKIGKLEKIDIKDVWPKEDKHFTNWLSQNLDALSDELGFELYLGGIEQSAGDFKVDIFAEDDNNNKVIIENQYDKSDHDHLGKILTYSRMLEAKTMIWICEKPRPEHADTINWLNEITPDDISFYLVKLDAFKIGNSKPAAKFTIICAPSVDRKQIGKIKKTDSEQDMKYLEFWTQLLERSKERTNIYRNISPGSGRWYQASAGKSYLSYVLQVNNESAIVELQIYSSKDEEFNREIFEKIMKNKETIEENFGEGLIWNNKPTVIRKTIRYKIESSGILQENLWNELQDEIITKLILLDKALRPFLDKV